MHMHDADRKRLAFGVVTAVFFMWGFITVLNDVLVPHLKAVFALDYTRIMLIQFCFFGAYFLMSLPSGKVVSGFGFKNSIILGLCIAAVGALLFFPAAVLQSYGVFLTALFVLASGITLLQVAANPYVSLLGPPAGASSRLNLSQAFNSLGTTLAPKFGGLFILSVAVLAPAELAKLSAPEQITYRLQQAQTVELPYIGIALTLFVLAVIVYLFHLPAVREMESPAATAHPYKEVLRHRHLFYGVIAIFLYVGAEVSIGSFMINYISLPAIGDMPEARAAGFVSLYWGGAMYWGASSAPRCCRRIDARKLLGVFAAVAALLVLTTMLSSGTLAVASVVSIGLFNSIMFPQHLPLLWAIEGLEPAHGPRLQSAYPGHRGRRHRAGGPGRARRRSRRAPCFRVALALLPQHRVLRLQRLAAGSRQPWRQAGAPPLMAGVVCFRRSAHRFPGGGTPALPALRPAVRPPTWRWRRRGSAAPAAFVGMLSRGCLRGFPCCRAYRRPACPPSAWNAPTAANTALAFVSLDTEGERRFTFYRPPAADLLFRPEHFKPGCFADAAVFHVCSNSLTETDIATTTLKACAQAGLPERWSASISTGDPASGLPTWMRVRASGRCCRKRRS